MVIVEIEGILDILGVRGLFFVGGDRIEGRSYEGESWSGEKKIFGING